MFIQALWYTIHTQQSYIANRSHVIIYEILVKDPYEAYGTT